MKQIVLTFGIWIVAAVSYKSLAQPPKEINKETEEIIIRKKGNKDIDVRIQITDDNVIINGKPLMEFKDDSVKIILRKFGIEDDRFMENFGRSFEGMARGFGDFNSNKTRTFLGVTTKSANDELEIESVTKEGPAEKAGLKAGDKLVSFNDTKLTSPQQLYELVTAQKVGNKAKIVFKRDGKKKTIQVPLAERKEVVSSFSWSENDGKRKVITIPNVPNAPNAPNVHFYDGNDGKGNNWAISTRPKLGLKIQDTEEGTSVKVISIDEASPAAKSGLLANDLITEIDGKKVSNTDEAREALHAVKDKNTYIIKGTRSGNPVSVTITIPKKLKTVTL